MTTRPSASTKPNPASSGDRWFVWLAIFLATALVILRKPWALQTPQLWAEDGSIFLNETELYGVAALFRSYQGYLHFIPRLIALGARAIADAAWWPLIYNGAALFITVGMLVRMASARIVVPQKPWLILAFAIAAQSGEVLLNVTNVQWIAAFFLFQQLLIAPPTNARQIAGDVVLTVLAGLTGPFAVLLLPFFVWRGWRDRTPGSWAVCIAVGGCAAIQTWSLLHGTGTPPAPRPEHFDLLNYCAVLGDRIVVWPFFGRSMATKLPSLALALIGTGVFLAVAFLVLRARANRRYETTLLLACLVLLAAVSWRARPDGWQAHDLDNGDRYYFIPRVLFAWLVVWQFDATRRAIAIGARVLCVIGALSELPNHAVPAPPDYHWKAHCDPIRRGVRGNIPTLPPGWTLEYPGRPAAKP